MAMLTVRNASAETLNALRARADQHGKSMEAEVHQILESTVASPTPVKLGSLLADIGRQTQLSDEEFAVFERLRSRDNGDSTR